MDPAPNSVVGDEGDEWVVWVGFEFQLTPQEILIVRDDGSEHDAPVDEPMVLPRDVEPIEAIRLPGGVEVPTTTDPWLVVALSILALVVLGFGGKRAWQWRQARQQCRK